MRTLPLGKLGESIAAEYLFQRGFKIIEKNFHKRWGEIDLITLKDDTLIFVEVKTRMVDDRVSPEESMTPWKINSVKKSALYYKMLHPELPESLRIDFVGIVLERDFKALKINHIENITL